MKNPEQVYFDRKIASWLFICAVVIFLMILLGGITRLTNSGLSMVEWKPLVGIIPPLSEAAWIEVFDKYKQFPEYQKINSHMNLAEFKSIFLFEYAHRVLGRLIGILFLLPFLYFKFTGKIKPGLTPKLVLLFFLGGMQGLLGWYMVKSGLVNNPHVSQYRLTAHLGLAVVVYGYMLWVTFDLLFADSRLTIRHDGLARFSVLLVALIFLMILSGGLVAGTHAGLAYNTWPLMGNSLVPAGLYSSSSVWLDIFENITTVQFNHRIFAYILFILISAFSLMLFKSKLPNRIKAGGVAFLSMLLLQLTLGITTLLFHVPVILGTAHQGGAVVLFTAALFVCHCLTRPNQSRQ
ncbi:MAG: COX15/CtaA family protein [Pseudomonadales bacterium]